jgi:hypothetical protein
LSGSVLAVGTVLAWLLSDPLGREKLALLALCMLAASVLSGHLTWRWARGRREKGVVAALGRSWLGRAGAQVLRACYYVGIPLAVLARGSLVREVGVPAIWPGGENLVWHLLGITQIDDLLHLGASLAIGIGALGVLVALWSWYARWMAASMPVAGSPWMVPWWVALREALFLQLVWALYRGIASMWVETPVYVSYTSFGLVALSWALSPARRHALQDPSLSPIAVQDWLFALFTAFVSLTLQSVWVLILLHTLWAWASGRVLAHLGSAHPLAKAMPVE